MRVVVLSDHGGEQLARSQRQYSEAAANAAAWQGYYAQSVHDADAARRAKPLLKRILGTTTPEEQAARARAGEAWQHAAAAGSGADHAYGRVQQQGAGVYGEDLLAWCLSGLPDEWVLLRGYRNRRGETDGILVGPHGVWAIEIKRRQVLLHAVGEHWWYQKISAKGRLYEQELAVDGGGRSWPRQVGEVAADLGAWLHKNGQPVPVRTAVMLMHERGQVVEIHDPRTDFVGTDPARLVGQIFDDAVFDYPAAGMPQHICEQITALIERDHRFHAARRRQ